MIDVAHRCSAGVLTGGGPDSLRPQSSGAGQHPLEDVPGRPDTTSAAVLLAVMREPVNGGELPRRVEAGVVADAG
ncbi:hypothetical protein [Actinomadura sp. NEAU-AAG7]|uniref:hypothetical protein n=1 Tax=Actinomadura sp. NEAU-AAG7 TaxID=2839640 RepID=UPI001BE3E5AB|nr:hypothetical protein [Actinomadura sp. NEAU-AAG7]